jgi:hypothetical protein
MVRLLAASLLAAGGCAADPLAPIFDRLYDFDFAAAHALVDAYIAEHPDEPIGYTMRSTAYLFPELDRLRILEAEFVTDDRKISGDDRLRPDPGARQRLFEAIEKAQRLAEARLRERPGDTMALFAYCLSEGVRADYMAFIEKRQFRSLFAIRKSHSYALEILKRDPGFVDAHLTLGIGEYLVGSLPFFLRWFIRFDQVKGNKDRAVMQLEKLAASARYLGPYARILLAILHLREKRPLKSIELLAGLARDFPANPLFRRELAKLREKHEAVGGQ